MFEPEKILKGLPLNDMTPAQLVAEIKRIASRAIGSIIFISLSMLPEPVSRFGMF